MPPATPVEGPQVLASDPHLHTVLQAVLGSAAPQEGCALLLGERGGGLCHLRQIWPCQNVWPRPAQRCRRFAIDPREQLVAQKWARQRGLVVLGSAHSHPASAPVPSATDLRLCLRPALQVIAGPDGELRVWWLAEDGALRELQWRLAPWRMVD
jgi:proteasome lid subunit RPN8/RPN11